MVKQKILDGIAREIRKERRNQSISQEELAYRADVDRSYLAQIESGKKNPSLVIFVKIAEGLGLSADALLKGSLK